jgi:hypothetical protein
MWIPVGEYPQHATTKAMARMILRGEAAVERAGMVGHLWADASSIRTRIVRHN